MGDVPRGHAPRLLPPARLRRPVRHAGARAALRPPRHRGARAACCCRWCRGRSPAGARRHVTVRLPGPPGGRDRRPGLPRGRAAGRGGASAGHGGLSGVRAPAPAPQPGTADGDRDARPARGDRQRRPGAQPADALWAQTRLNHRRDITRAQQAWLRRPHGRRVGASRHLPRLYRDTMARRRRPRPTTSSRTPTSTACATALGDQLHLCVVEGEGGVAAAGLFVETSGIVEYHLSGSERGLLARAADEADDALRRALGQERGDTSRSTSAAGVGAQDDSLLQFKVGLLAPAAPVPHAADRRRRGASTGGSWPPATPRSTPPTATGSSRCTGRT